MARSPKPRVAISACLLGEQVRYDGGDKRAPEILAAFGALVEWVPVCPELELGMGVPREPIRLLGRVAAPRVVGVESGVDHTAAMRRFARLRVDALSRQGLDGWVAKSGSPSCGLRGVPVHAARGGEPAGHGTGIFAAVLRARRPDLPVAEEGRLADPAARARFLAEVRAQARQRAVTPSGPPQRKGAPGASRRRRG